MWTTDASSKIKTKKKVAVGIVLRRAKLCLGKQVLRLSLHACKNDKEDTANDVMKLAGRMGLP